MSEQNICFEYLAQQRVRKDLTLNCHLGLTLEILAVFHSSYSIVYLSDFLSLVARNPPAPVVETFCSWNSRSRVPYSSLRQDSYQRWPVFIALSSGISCLMVCPFFLHLLISFSHLSIIPTIFILSFLFLPSSFPKILLSSQLNKNIVYLPRSRLPRFKFWLYHL